MPAKAGIQSGFPQEVATTQDQLAAVIGHEVAHVIASHSAKRYSEAKAANLGSTAADDRDAAV